MNALLASRTARLLAAVAGLPLLLTACTPAQPDLALGTATEFPAGPATVSLSVDDIHQATSDEVTEAGLRPKPDKVFWFVTYKMALVKGEVGSLDPAQVYPADEAWTAETNRGGEVKQTKVLGANFDCTKDKSATAGIGKDGPFINCILFELGPNATVESVTVDDRGTWSTTP